MVLKVAIQYQIIRLPNIQSQSISLLALRGARYCKGDNRHKHPPQWCLRQMCAITLGEHHLLNSELSQFYSFGSSIIDFFFNNSNLISLCQQLTLIFQYNFFNILFVAKTGWDICTLSTKKEYILTKWNMKKFNTHQKSLFELSVYLLSSCVVVTSATTRVPCTQLYTQYSVIWDSTITHNNLRQPDTGVL